MKFYFICPVCSKFDGCHLNVFFEDSLNDEDISEYQCPKGHKFIIVSRNDKYRILFDEAILQLQDGFYNNSVLNAFTALEEFMNYFIKFMLFQKDKSIEDILKITKLIRSSENKKGAFILSLYENLNKIIVKSEINDLAKLRNEIIHDGKFIDFDSAYSYCEKIYDFITSILKELSDKYTEEDCAKIDLAYQIHFFKNNSSVGHSMITSSPSILNSVGVKDDETFNEKYKNFKITKEYAYKNPLKNINIGNDSK